MDNVGKRAEFAFRLRRAQAQAFVDGSIFDPAPFFAERLAEAEKGLDNAANLLQEKANAGRPDYPTGT